MCIKFDTWFKSKYINIMSANAWKVVISAFSYLTTVTFIYDIRELSPQHPQIVSSAFVHSCVHFLHGKMTIKRSKCLYACFLCTSSYNLNYYIFCYSSRCYWCTLKDFFDYESNIHTSISENFFKTTWPHCTFGGFGRDVPSGLPGWYWGYVGSGKCRFIGVLAGEWGRGSLLVCILVRYPARGWRGGDRYILVIGY